jgi:hypothetical protein
MKRSKIETGTLIVNGSCLGPAERDPATGNIELGPNVTERSMQRIDLSPFDASTASLVTSLRSFVAQRSFNSQVLTGRRNNPCCGEPKHFFTGLLGPPGRGELALGSDSG